MAQWVRNTKKRNKNNDVSDVADVSGRRGVYPPAESPLALLTGYAPYNRY
jgi:hypothetical protein